MSLREEVAREFGIAPADQKFTAVREDLPMDDAALLPVYYDRVANYFGPGPKEGDVHFCEDSFVSADVCRGPFVKGQVPSSTTSDGSTGGGPVMFLGREDNILVRLSPAGLEECEMNLEYGDLEADTIHEGTTYCAVGFKRGVVRLADVADLGGATTRVENANTLKLMVPNDLGVRLLVTPPQVRLN
jgi:hypothetical protein